MELSPIAVALSYPFPPTILQRRIEGHKDNVMEHIIRGRVSMRDIRVMLKEAGRELNTFKHILDFGCGCGKVLRWLPRVAPYANFYGTDIDEEMIDWCKNHIPIAEYATNKPSPPLSYADNTFNLILAISVFPQMDSDEQRKWLAEFKRIAKPDALILLSTRGEPSSKNLSQYERKLLKQDGILTKMPSVYGAPSCRKTTVQTPSYTTKECERLFKVVHTKERGMLYTEDVILLENTLQDDT